jgi:RNA polymerase sigma factor (sigma-70 family)
MNPSEEQLEQLYKEAFPQAARLVKALGGDADTARDLFHDALIIFLEKQQKDDLQIKTSATAYVVGITRMLWYHHFRKTRKELLFDDELHDTVIPDEFYEEDRAHSSLLQKLQQAGQRCLQLLSAFYYEKQSMQEIAGNFNYKSVRSATVQKYKCLEKLREQVKKTTAYEKAA